MMTTDSDCLFCKIIEGAVPSDKVFEDQNYFAFKDINPQAPTHVLIIPKKHIATLNDIRPADAELVGGMTLLAARLAEESGVADEGYRTVFNCNEGAGQTVFHVHLHLLGGRSLSWPPG